MSSKISQKLTRILNAVQTCCNRCKTPRTKSGEIDATKASPIETIRVTNDLRQISSFYDFEGEVLGRGRYGETRIVVNKQTRLRFACKTINKSDLICVGDLDALKREIDFLKLFKGYDSIASFHDVFEDANAVHIILELCTGGELFNKIIERKRYPEHEAAMMIRSILSTVALCHDHYIVHSDLKPENFIFSHKGPGANLKAIDFGISQFCQQGECLTDLVGTLSYMAPEVLKRKYGFPVDMWSCGVILYLLICGQPPFYGKSKEDVAKAVLFWDIDFSFEPWPSVSESLKKCINRMLDRDPETRATAREILFCDWMIEQHAAPLQPIPNALYTKLVTFSKYNLLKKVSLKFIAGNLPESDKVALHVLFHQLKRADSTAISVNELEAALANQGETKVRKVDILQLFHDIDITGSDQISYLDFVAANMRLGQLASKENIEHIFSMIDQDGNGYVTVDELRVFLNHHCAPYEPSPKEIQSIIESTDINCDGFIDFGEFLALMKGSF